MWGEKKQDAEPCSKLGMGKNVESSSYMWFLYTCFYKIQVYP